METRLQIVTQSGLMLAGILHTPNTSNNPLVILLHGFTGWKEEKHIETLAEDLAAHGIAALRFDAPGSGESEGTFEHDYTMSNYIAAVADVLQYAKNIPGIDSSQIGLWGHSMGGFVALASAVKYPDIRAVCCCQPSSGWKVMEAEAERSWKESGWAVFSNGRFPEIRLPYSFLTDRAQYDATKESPRLDIPSLFIAGTYDTDVMPEGVKTMAALAPQPSEYMEFPATHGYKRDPNMLNTITTATTNFFKEYLLGTPA